MPRTPVPTGAPLPLPPDSPFRSAEVAEGYYTSKKGQQHRLGRGVCRVCGAEHFAPAYLFTQGRTRCATCAGVRRATREVAKAAERALRAAAREAERAERIAAIVAGFPKPVAGEVRALYARGAPVETLARVYKVKREAIKALVADGREAIRVDLASKGGTL